MSDSAEVAAPARSAAEERRAAAARKIALRAEKAAAVEANELEKLADELIELRLRHLVEADQPLVLIAQPNRSGGTLLSQLFDGHPELHVHPWELEIGDSLEPWPELDLDASPEAWHKELYERHIRRAYDEGYSKDKSSLATGHNEQERFPFMMPPGFQRKLFLSLASQRPVSTQRDVLDLHFTSYFNSWLDNQNLYCGPKRWVVAFRGRMRRPENLAQFFREYPDGRHISMLRDAKGNIASRLKYRTREDVEGAVRKATRAWQRATELQLETKRRYGDRMFLLTFEQLVTDTTGVMRGLSDWLGVHFDPVLTQPTFNRLPIRASSHFRVEDHGVLREPLEHWRKVLTEEQGAWVDDLTSTLYRRFEALAVDDLARAGRS